MQTVSQPLARHPLLRSDDVEELALLLSAQGWRFAPAAPGRQGGRAGSQVNTVLLPNLRLSFVRYGIAGALAAEERGEYTLVLPVEGGFQAVADGREIAGPASGVVGSSHSALAARLPAGSSRLLLSIPHDAVVRHLSALLDDAVGRAPVFEPALRLESGAGRHLAALIGHMAAHLDAPESPLSNPLMTSQLEQTLLSALLLGQSSNYTERLERPVGKVLPARLKRALDYIHANLAQPIAIADLVAASGVAGRTLHDQFRQFLGVPPMAYVRKARLRRVHDELARAAGGETVSASAWRWGFQHMGRFAAEYRRHFGEHPSETRARSRARRL